MGDIFQSGDRWIAFIGEHEHKVRLLSRDGQGWWSARELETGAEFSLPERWLRFKLPDEDSPGFAAFIVE